MKLNAQFLLANRERGAWSRGGNANGTNADAIVERVREEKPRGFDLLEWKYVHNQHEMARPLGARKREDIRDVDLGIGDRPWSRTMIRHSMYLLRCA